MSDSTAAETTQTGPALIVPEERFWMRYSPRGEAKLSFAGSIALHALVVGALCLAAVYFASLFVRPARGRVPVDLAMIAPGPDGPRPVGDKPNGPPGGGDPEQPDSRQ